jgi:hypothetical protein
VFVAAHNEGPEQRYRLCSFSNPAKLLKQIRYE